GHVCRSVFFRHRSLEGGRESQRPKMNQQNKSQASGCDLSAGEAIIRCEGLTKRFGNFTAVDQISFSIAKGSIFGFLGPNGSGKSTVIRMLCGILEPSEGRAFIAGVDVVKDADSLKGLIGYMSQKFSLYDELTVRENLQFYG